MTDSSNLRKTWKKIGGPLCDSVELAFLSSETETAWGYLKKGSDLFLLKKEVAEGVPFTAPLAVDQVTAAVEGWLDSVEAVSQEVFFGVLSAGGVAGDALIARVKPLLDLVTVEPGRVVEVV